MIGINGLLDGYFLTGDVPHLPKSWDSDTNPCGGPPYDLGNLHIWQILADSPWEIPAEKSDQSLHLNVAFKYSENS